MRFINIFLLGASAFLTIFVPGFSLVSSIIASRDWDEFPRILETYERSVGISMSAGLGFLMICLLINIILIEITTTEKDEEDL